MVGTLSFCALAAPGALCAVCGGFARWGECGGGLALCVASGLACFAAATAWRDGAGLCVEGGGQWREFLLFAGSFKFLPGMESCLPSGSASGLFPRRRSSRNPPRPSFRRGDGREGIPRDVAGKSLGGLFAWFANVFWKLPAAWAVAALSVNHCEREGVLRHFCNCLCASALLALVVLLSKTSRFGVRNGSFRGLKRPVLEGETAGVAARRHPFKLS